MPAHPQSSNIPGYREALKMAGGVVSAAALHLGIARGELEAHIIAFPALAQVIEDIRQTTVDFCEQHLTTQARKGDLKAIDRILEGPWGQKRGWGPKASQVNVAVIQQDQQLKVALADMPIEQMRALVDAVATADEGAV